MTKWVPRSIGSAGTHVVDTKWNAAVMDFEHMHGLTSAELPFPRNCTTEEQRKVKDVYREYVSELRRLERELDDNVQRADESETKLVWRSPFEHRQKQQQRRKVEREAKKAENLEKVQYLPQY